MSVEKGFDYIFKGEREKDLSPFLRSLTDEQKKSFLPQFRVLVNEYLEYRQVKAPGGGITFKQKAGPVQARMLVLASFVFLSRKEFEKVNSNWLESKHYESVLSWYCPSWFNDYINSFSAGNFVPRHITYDWAMSLQERGFLKPTIELIVRLLPQAVLDQDDKYQWHYNRENLLKRPVTLEEHIWYLFEHDSMVANTDRFMQYAGGAEHDHIWMRALEDYSRDGKISRSRLLKESVLATARNFNKTLSGWFTELFLRLEPAKEELLVLQKELLAAMNSPHSKTVNMVLNAFKKIVDDKTFDTPAFIGSVPLLLSSETKTVVSSTLMLLDKLAKKNKDLLEQICVAACQAFIHREDDVQTRAAKLIDRYGDPSSEIVKLGSASRRESV
jgi:hypothetical protein